MRENILTSFKIYRIIIRNLKPKGLLEQVYFLKKIKKTIINGGDGDQNLFFLVCNDYENHH